jgi:TPP-dependent pyruvate/acetoin dehydrogenase alpha subunit
VEIIHNGNAAGVVVAARRLALLETMCRIRAFEEVALDLARRGDVVGAVHPYTGHEAVAAGVGDQLGPDDHVVSYYRCHGHALAAGLAPTAMFAELLGRASGVNKGKGGSMHLADRSRRFLGGNSIVGAGVGIAAGMAAALQIRRAPGAVVVFLGDGAMGAGVVLETLRISARQRLPLLFVCENNGYQDRTRSSLVSDRAPAEVATGLGVPAVVTEGNDVEEVATAAAGLLDEVRGAGGARFLEALTYLRDFHCQLGSATPDPYRPEDEVRWWLAHDPIVLAGQTLGTPGITEESLPALRERAHREMVDAAATALREPLPTPDEALHDLTTGGW